MRVVVFESTKYKNNRYITHSPITRAAAKYVIERRMKC